jgi:hypothetical protein
MWGRPLPGRGPYRDWQVLKALTMCWRQNCPETVDKDGLGLCKYHIEEMRFWSDDSQEADVGRRASSLAAEVQAPDGLA